MDKKDIENELKKVWQEDPALQSPEKKEAFWDAFAAQAFPPKKRRRKPWLYAVAAVLIISIGAGIVVTFNEANLQHGTLASNIVENPTSGIKFVQLPDSSIVELDPGARIEYSSDFAGNRKISLEGRAFFKVQKDKKHPFRVSCRETTTTVLGTSFTIAGNDENAVRVHLYEGSVQMNVKNSSNNWILSPGEQFIYSNKAVSVEAFDRFKDFDKEELSIVVRYISQNYGYKVEMPEEYLKKEITLRLNRKEDLSNIISIIAQMYNLTPTTDEELKKITFQ